MSDQSLNLPSSLSAIVHLVINVSENVERVADRDLPTALNLLPFTLWFSGRLSGIRYRAPTDMLMDAGRGLALPA